ncbi:1,3-beta-galactosyl-N-acetylhexosamine phosphorylase [Bacillus mobilis]|uniref:1,3-beta-galactosyl-N-acetylhexosamine phosphorylase n=1 Tax=Bacillus cereus group TaxID=86661 RepID=UPI000BF910F6|nr:MULTISPECIES: 1,3-beta-galactosyl-N-acetylhexosamine phosphorylase [Bacillus cereus group]MED0936755.1 1,3-beta-galactosyl-N-acetylhexosamine phosphorylase [Bacillus mobilis]PFO67229.1 1,3-beta-galactosyl-N-acetylhexosamine phosphorylase [Bacillus cereus]PGU45734.1 1,3-beta-galactosyl-N-acetylhexosamine phosphorylase [Bacillus cereus]
MKKKKGRVTLPSEENFLKETKELMERWGADAIRDSDGTKLDDDIKQLDAKIYTTYFVARAHNEFAEKHMDECQQLYLMSLFNTAITDTLEIDFMKGYFEEQLKPDYIHSPKKYWEVIDRTTGKIVDVNDWEVNEEKNHVLITDAIPWHEYTVSFLVYAIWDPTQMYNHITNNWGDKPHDIPFDVRQPHSNEFMKNYLKQWLTENPDTDVVRFTTFFYHFTLVFNNLGKEKFVDWFGYGASVSVAALDAFQKEKGYRLRPEDIVDQGYYNTSFRIPTTAFLDYIDFVHKFVAEEAKKLVDIVHESGKEAMMFLGDNWIGTEPYGKYFENIGLDAVVGSVGGGATLRMIADIPHVRYTEGRFLPYFFPDTFYEGNNPTIEANENWLTARRALLRNPVDRIGYGGYLSLAYQFPEFISYIEKVTEEFREIHDTIKGVQPYSGLKVTILNSWGKLRTWQTHMVAHALWYKQIYSYLGVLESLSGAAVEVSFISFDDVINEGIPEDIDVIINAGDVGTAFSGGANWINEKLVTTIRAWMYNGGGFIGIGEPTAYQHEGHYFQLANVLGVDKELGFSLSTDKYFINPVENHFISADSTQIDFGEGMKNIYALSDKTEIIEYSNGEVHLSSHPFGEGRAVYIAGLPYSEENTRLLMRALYYAANKEGEFQKYHASNIYCEVHAYPSIQKMAIVNNSMIKQTTAVYDGQGKRKEVTLAPSEIRWEDFSNED